MVNMTLEVQKVFGKTKLGKKTAEIDDLPSEALRLFF